MKRFFTVLLALAVAMFAIVATAGAQTTPEFKLGFKVLADQLPDQVGQPLENEGYAPNGDALQRTTNGIMVWRSADNWTAFTDGFQSWVNGPNGIQTRLNDQRFDWEPAATPTPAPQPRVTWSKPYVVRGSDIYSNTAWVMGEVKNEGDAPGYEIAVVAKLLSPSGEVVRTESTTIEYLGPGDTAAYQVTFKNPPAFTSADVSASAKMVGPRKYDRLMISKGMLQRLGDEYGGTILTYAGIATNGTGSTLKYCKVNVWFVDAQNNVVWVDTAFASPGELTQGASGSFERRSLAARFDPGISGATQARTFGWGAY